MPTTDDLGSVVASLDQAVRTLLAHQPEEWVRLAPCHAAAGYSAGVLAPGLPPAWGVSFWGWATARSRDQVPAPPPVARLDLAGPLPAVALTPRLADQWAALAALYALRYLGEQGWSVAELTLWGGPDLRPQQAGPTPLDPLIAALRPTLSWVVPYPKLLLQPAAQCDPASGWGAAHQGAQHWAQRTSPTNPPPPDYVLSLTAGPSPPPGPVEVGYRLQTRQGHQRQAQLTVSDLTHPQEGSYRLLITVLSNLLERIRQTGQQPDHYHLEVRSPDPLVLQTLQAPIAGGASRGPAGATSVRGLLRRFGRVTFQRESESPPDS